MGIKIKDILNKEENKFISNMIIDGDLIYGSEVTRLLTVVNFMIDIYKNYKGAKGIGGIANLKKLEYLDADWCEGSTNNPSNNIFKETRKHSIEHHWFLDKIIYKIYKVKKEEDNNIDRMSSLTYYNYYLENLNKLKYSEYLRSEHWQHFRGEAIKFYNNKCQLCGKNESGLNVHHNDYENKGRETFNDVTLLCKSCHEKFHGITNTENINRVAENKLKYEFGDLVEIYEE